MEKGPNGRAGFLISALPSPAAEADSSGLAFASNSLQRRKKGLLLRPVAPLRTRPPLLISLPQDFRQVSSVIDVDLLPETHRRVRLHKHGSDRPLGFYIRDGIQITFKLFTMTHTKSGPCL